MGGGEDVRPPPTPSGGIEERRGISKKDHASSVSTRVARHTSHTHKRHRQYLNHPTPCISRLDIDETTDPCELDDILATRRVGSGERTESTEAASEEIAGEVCLA